MPEVPFHLPQAAPGPGLEAITARQWRELFHRTEVLWHAQYVAPLYKYQTATSMHLGVRPDLRGRGAATGTGSVLAPVVLIRRDLKSIPPSLVIRKVKYIDAKPQVGRYEIVGDVANHEQDITAYPDFGHTIADYEDFEWDATGPTIEDQFLTARRERGVWLVELLQTPMTVPPATFQWVVITVNNAGTGVPETPFSLYTAPVVWAFNQQPPNIDEWDRNYYADSRRQTFAYPFPGIAAGSYRIPPTLPITRGVFRISPSDIYGVFSVPLTPDILVGEPVIFPEFRLNSITTRYVLPRMWP